jgi:hypothetical protein
MNRKDFIKSLVVGAAIAPVVAKAAVEEKPSTPVTVKPVSQEPYFGGAIQIQCTGYKTSKDIEYLELPSEDVFNRRTPIVVEVNTAIYGVDVSKFNSLIEAMNERKELFCVEYADEAGWNNSKVIQGWITQMEVEENETVTLEIQHCKP